ncbi:hypothetical protein Pcinc_042851 [Petrolisthes cinctipes]|uniref:Uncharacterized protein n=1 Tax=Petrolisthes cinctipes TaxID=88211 RepID=A0AAE1EFM6_PETCI|nr:hypothetical protein Pcinc_042851 [Petrolisthes cinctipes]
MRNFELQRLEFYMFVSSVPTRFLSYNASVMYNAGGSEAPFGVSLNSPGLPPANLPSLTWSLSMEEEEDGEDEEGEEKEEDEEEEGEEMGEDGEEAEEEEGEEAEEEREENEEADDEEEEGERE